MIAFVLRVPAAEAEVASDALWSCGVAAVEERLVVDGRGDEVELWTAFGDEVSGGDSLPFEPASGWCARWEHVDDAVVDTWRRFAVPVEVAPDLVVCPAWIPFVTDRTDVEVISIEPGVTFGLGDHPTTQLSLAALRREVRRRRGCAVLDVGCGSGVLAIGASRWGAARVVAIDLAPAAVPVTLDNAARNGVPGQVEVSNTPLARLEGRFDVVVANILAPTLVELSADLLRVLADEGTLVLSGVLAGRFDHVAAAMAPARLEHVDELDGWAALTMRR